MNKYDVIKFKCQLNKIEITDFGIIKDVIHEDDCIFYQVLPFNLKLYSLFLIEENIIMKICKCANFNFINDETNHNYKIGEKFYLQLNEDFFNKFINEVGYYYWNTINEVKEVFQNYDLILCEIKEYWGPNIYHVETNVHDLRLNDKLIHEFKL